MIKIFSRFLGRVANSLVNFIKKVLLEFLKLEFTEGLIIARERRLGKDLFKISELLFEKSILR